MRAPAAFLLVSLLAACGAAPDEVSVPSNVKIEVGKPFPNLILPALHDGSPSSLADFRGKKTLLHVFASW